VVGLVSALVFVIFGFGIEKHRGGVGLEPSVSCPGADSKLRGRGLSICFGEAATFPSVGAVGGPLGRWRGCFAGRHLDDKSRGLRGTGKCERKMGFGPGEKTLLRGRRFFFP